MNSVIIHFHTHTLMHGSTPPKLVNARYRVTFSNHLQTLLGERQHWIPLHHPRHRHTFDPKPLLLSRTRAVQWLMDQSNRWEKQNLNSCKRTQGFPSQPQGVTGCLHQGSDCLLPPVQEMHLSPQGTASEGEDEAAS